MGCRRAALLAALTVAAGIVHAETPGPAPELVAAARAEGRVVVYTSMDLDTADALVKAFEKAYPGVAVQLERSGAERNYQRVMQERAANLQVADLVATSDT